MLSSKHGDKQRDLECSYALVRPLVTLHPKRVHCSGGELEAGGGLGGSALAAGFGFDLAAGSLGGAVAVADVVGERVAEGGPGEVGGGPAGGLVGRGKGGVDAG